MRSSGKTSAFVVLACATAGTIVVGLHQEGWAITACQKPNPSTVYCVQGIPVSSCTGLNETDCKKTKHELVRNKWPEGHVPSPTGTTTQELTDCWQAKSCAWHVDLALCVANPTMSDWVKLDKTVEGTATCPTEE